MKHVLHPSFGRLARRVGVVFSAVGLSLSSFGTGYTWSSGVAEGNWSDPASWGESGYPMESSDTAKFSSATAVVNLDEAPSIASVADTFISSDVKFVGGKTLKISGSNWKIMKSAKIEASGTGTKVWFSGDGCKYIYGSGNLLRASDGGCIEVRGFKPGTAMWDITSNLPSNMSIEADGESSLIILRMDNNTPGIAGNGFTFKASNGGEIQYGLGRSESKYCKNADFLSKNASVVLDDGSFVMGYTGFSMSTENSGQSIELKGALPLLNAATYVTIGNSTADVTLKFMPEAAWANETTARVQSGTTATIGAHTILVVDGSVFGAVAGTKIIPLVSGKTELALAEGVIEGASITGFPSGVTASLVTNADDNSLLANTLYLKLVSSVRAVEVPTVEGVTYDGQAHTPVVAPSDDYTITTLPQDVVDAGEYDVVLTLNAAGTAWADDGTTDPKTLKFVIAKAANFWEIEPSLSKTTWEYLDPAAMVTAGKAMTGESAVVTYDGDSAEMPVTVGNHTAVFTVAETKNCEGLSKTISYTVKPRTNTWVEEPFLTLSKWAFNETPGTVLPGKAASGGEVVVTYDDGLTEMPTALGAHKAVCTVAASETYTALSRELPFEITKKVNGWMSEPVVEPTRYTADSLPTFTPPKAAFGEVVRYFDGDPANTEVPTSMGKHLVTYAVAEGDDYQPYEQTIELTVLDVATLGVAQVAIIGYDGSETLTNFPALVRFSADNIKGLSAALLSEDGSDVRVYGEDGNELPFEIESWDREGESIIWVKIPELAPKSEKLTSVFVKWGATEERTTEPADVWTEYLAVWHMNDTTIVDATGNGTALTGTGSLIDGEVGKALSASKGLAMSENFVDACPAYAVSCWYRYGSAVQVSPLMKGKYQGNGWYLEYKGSTTSMNYIIGSSKSGVTTPDMLDNWNHVSVNLVGGKLTGYVNGTKKNEHSKQVSVDDFNLSVLGNAGNGRVDELRIRKSAESAAWAKADYLAQTGDLVTYALVQNPEVEDVVVAPSETAPFVDNERNMTIGYRVASTGGSTVTVSALYAMEGADTTNETVIGSSPVAQTEDAFGTIEDLKPGVNYWVAVYGVNASGAASEPTAWQQVAVPGPVAIEDVEFSQTKEEATITGVITGLGTKTAKLRYAFGKDEFAEIDLVLGEDGAFTVTLDRVSVTDVLTYQVVANNTLSTTTWGDFAWSAETEVKDSKDSVPVTYTWTGAASDEWADPENWEASVASAFGYPNSSEYATAKFTQAATVDLAGGTFGLVAEGLKCNANLGEVTLRNGKIAVPYSDVAYGANGTTVIFDNVTISGQKGLKFVDGSTVVFKGTTAQGWQYEPWGNTGATTLKFCDGLISSGYFQTWIRDSANHKVYIDNAVWTLKNTGSGQLATKFYLIDGVDRQAQFVSENGFSLAGTWYIPIPETGHVKASIVGKTAANAGGTFQLELKDWKRGRRVPLVTYTGADQTTTIQGLLDENKLKLSLLVDGKAESEEDAASRNGHLEWDETKNTLYYKQTARSGFVVILQ